MTSLKSECELQCKEDSLAQEKEEAVLGKSKYIYGDAGRSRKWYKLAFLQISYINTSFEVRCAYGQSYLTAVLFV